VERGNERFQLGGGEELDLVEKKDHTRLVLSCSFADRDEQFD
jgi:hypothetical protein